MEERRRPLAAQQPGERDLTACRLQQIFAADHKVDPLP